MSRVVRERIDRAFKGTAATETIGFGPHHEYEIGKRYLLFLTKPDKRFDPVNSTHSHSMAEEERFRNRCDSKQFAYRSMHNGCGALAIKWTEALDSKDAVLVPSRYVTFRTPSPGRLRTPESATGSRIRSRSQSPTPSATSTRCGRCAAPAQARFGRNHRPAIGREVPGRDRPAPAEGLQSVSSGRTRSAARKQRTGSVDAAQRSVPKEPLHAALLRPQDC
jgi:hypothetical protein